MDIQVYTWFGYQLSPDHRLVLCLWLFPFRTDERLGSSISNDKQKLFVSEARCATAVEALCLTGRRKWLQSLVTFILLFGILVMTCYETVVQGSSRACKSQHANTCSSSRRLRTFVFVDRAPSGGQSIELCVFHHQFKSCMCWLDITGYV